VLFLSLTGVRRDKYWQVLAHTGVVVLCNAAVEFVNKIYVQCYFDLVVKEFFALTTCSAQYAHLRVGEREVTASLN
jgi:hypothetical protein